MKTKLIVMFLALAISSAMASLYQYPARIRPEVSLADAVSIADAMLRMQGEGQKYHVVRAELFGDEKQSGDGAWNLHLCDVEGSRVTAHVFLKKSVAMLRYSNGKEIEFQREGLKVSGPSKERHLP